MSRTDPWFLHGSTQTGGGVTHRRRALLDARRTGLVLDGLTRDVGGVRRTLPDRAEALSLAVAHAVPGGDGRARAGLGQSDVAGEVIAGGSVLRAARVAGHGSLHAALSRQRHT